MTNEAVDIFSTLESEVRSYARAFPVVFNCAFDSCLVDDKGRRYLDFLAGAGTLNYGHNNPTLKRALLDYIERDGITHGLDMHTCAKADFLGAFSELILAPRGMEYVMQFTGPTGTNAVEAALKLVRNITGRHNIIAFTNGFHGVTLGAMAATGNSHHRGAAGIAMGGVTRLPYDGYLDGVNTALLLEKMLGDSSSGVDLPAAVILETVQGEGGLNVASDAWLRSVERICRQHGVLLIVDDIQAGCGRTGTFFSFESAGIRPDIIALSKSLSGYGLPFAVALIRPHLDRWKPGQHNGTFRGNNHAFVTATAALRKYWSDETFASAVQEKSRLLTDALEAIAAQNPAFIAGRKGRGMMQGLACHDGNIAQRITRSAFDKGLVIETSGPNSEVVKCLCPLTISRNDLQSGLKILARCVEGLSVSKPIQLPTH